MKYCCDKFKHEATAPYEGKGIPMYPSTVIPKTQIQQVDDGTWAVNGCCWGGCFVLGNMKFCPFCGTKLPDKKEIDNV
jgi:hypothetical protein